MNREKALSPYNNILSVKRWSSNRSSFKQSVCVCAYASKHRHFCSHICVRSCKEYIILYISTMCTHTCTHTHIYTGRNERRLLDTGGWDLALQPWEGWIWPRVFQWWWGDCIYVVFLKHKIENRRQIRTFLNKQSATDWFFPVVSQTGPVTWPLWNVPLLRITFCWHFCHVWEGRADPGYLSSRFMALESYSIQDRTKTQGCPHTQVSYRPSLAARYLLR